MQTFLPFPDFAESAAVLDRQRLGKQRVETLQIMKALLLGEGWINHPATKMWRGSECDLLVYQAAVCDEWTGRGYQDTCLDKTIALWKEHHHTKCVDLPWLGDSEFHMSHQSNLIRKDPAHYGPLFPGIPADYGYIWPMQERE